MKHILSLTSYKILPYSSGGQKAITLFNEYLGTKTDLTMVGTKDNDLSLVKHFRLLPIIPNNVSKFFNFSLFFTLKKIIRKENISYVIVEHPYLAWIALLLKKVTGVKFIIRTHNIEFERFKALRKRWWPILKTYETFMLKKADHVFCISDEDGAYMRDKLNISPNNITVIPFGITQQEWPTDKEACRNIIAAKHRIKVTEKILLFNGALDYMPNFAAVKTIVEEINPFLLDTPSFAYKIIICGRGLPASMNELKEYSNRNIIYAGFVENIETYVKAADVFMNPIIEGGGVKTKLVEALGFDTTAISTVSGAIGCDLKKCGDKITIVNDNDWKAFAEAIIAAGCRMKIHTPEAFYDYYYWGNVAKTAVNAL